MQTGSRGFMPTFTAFDAGFCTRLLNGTRALLDREPSQNTVLRLKSVMSFKGFLSGL